MGLTGKQWLAFAGLMILVSGLTVLFNVIDANGQLAAAVVVTVGGVGSGLIAVMDPRDQARPGPR